MQANPSASVLPISVPPAVGVALAGAPGIAPVACSHCDLPVPAALVEPEGDEQFCCQGCRTVYAVIREAGLERYYHFRDDGGAEAVPARTTDKAYTEFDDPTFSELYCRPARDGLVRVELYVEGIHCSACVWLIEKGALGVDGCVEVTLDMPRSRVDLVYDPVRVALGSIARRLDSLGYPVHPPHGARALDARRREDRALITRIAVAGAIAGNVMLMAFALYGGEFAGMEDEYRTLFRWASLVVTAPSVLWAALPFYRGALGALRNRTAHMDLPISVGILTGFGWGVVGTFRSNGEPYFDSITALIFLLLVGRFIQRRMQHAATDAAELLHALAPASARLFSPDGAREVPIQTLTPGDVVEVRASDTVPVDGTVIEGDSVVDGSLLTGESRPVEVTTGGFVHAGTTNLGARLLVRVEKSGASTRIAKLLAGVEETRRRRAPIVVLADRIAGRFVVAALGLALLTLCVWLYLDPARAVDHAVALLVVTCPCALGMATPLAVSVALGRAARRGIFVKGADAIEALARPGLVVFDKTGTLTEGKLELVEWEGDESAKSLVLAVEEHSAHPIAAAFLRALAEEPRLGAREVRQTLGGGVHAMVGERRVLVGAPHHVRKLASRVPDWCERSLGRQASLGRTPVLVAVDGEVTALVSFGDPLRPDARACLRELRELGYELCVLSGDHPDVVMALARELGVPLADARGGVTPEDKLAYVERALARGPVFMVGDGVNDAGALSAATVGIAVHGGAEASLAAADAFLTRGGISPVVELVKGARRTLRVIRRNLAFSLVYNAAGVALAVTGLIGPLIAAIMMPVSSLTVVTSSFRARTFRSPK